MKRIPKNRIISLFLALIMIFTALPVSSVIANATEYESTNYGSNIGCTAEFVESTIFLLGDPENIITDQMITASSQLPSLVKIENYVIAGSTVYYQIDAAPGYTWPEDYNNYHYVEERTLNIHACGMVGVFVDGDIIDPAEGLELPQYEKLEITAESTLQGEVTYQWQIRYDTDSWVDIWGEDGKTIKLSYGMLANMLDENGIAYVRCRSISGIKEAFCTVIPICITPYTDSEEVTIQTGIVTSAGNTVNVQVSGDIPSGSSVKVEESDSYIATDYGEELLIVLNISVTNADGTEWQPADGEYVTVSIPAETIGLSENDVFIVYHEHNGAIEKIGPYSVYNGEVAFTIDGFSAFGFARVNMVFNATDLIENIGKYGMLNECWDSLSLHSAPAQISDYNGIWWNASAELYEDLNEDMTFVITDYYVSDIYPYAVWYKVEAAPGYTLPDVIAENPWIWQNWNAETYADEDALVLTDATPVCNVTVDGAWATEVAISTSEKVTLTAKSTLNSADVSYQWQVYIPSVDMWVDVSGDTSAQFDVTYGKVGERTDENGIAYVRCVATAGAQSATSNSIVVYVSETASAMMTSTFSTSSVNALAIDGDDGNTTIYNVVINYVFEDNNPAATPYTTTVGATATFNATVEFAEVPGYLPYLNDVQTESYTFNLVGSEMTDDINLTVVYKPTLVDYTVIVMKQNSYDDNYTEVGTVTLQGLTGSVTKDIDLSYAGFYQLLHDEAIIAADGSTKIEVRFDRYYYLMTFELGDGGYGVQPVYARYETEVEAPDPTRPGYVFKNWTDPAGNIVESPITMPAYDIEITANWIPSNAKYTVVYWKENAEPNADGTYGYSYWGSVVKDSISGMLVSGSDDIPESITYATVDGSQVDEKVYFTYNDTLTDKNIVVKGDGTTVVNVYYTRNTYTLYFYGYGTCCLNEHTHGTGCNTKLICFLEEHTHTDECIKTLTCNISEHTVHTADCLTCAKTEHTEHSDDCLVCTHTTHTIDCYSAGYNRTLRATTKPNQITGTTFESGQVYTYTTGNNGNRETHYYLYLEGQWYCAHNNDEQKRDTSSINLSCTHTHTTDCYKDEIHEHDDTCYSDVIHTHVESCYNYSCGKATHTHTDDCYSECTIPAHTHKNVCDRNSTDNVVYVITAKYEADISAIWPTYDVLKSSENSKHYKDTGGNVENSNNQKFRGWSLAGSNTTSTSKRMNMTAELCSAAVSASKTTAVYGYTYYVHLYYMFESFDQTSPADDNMRHYYNGTYYDYSVEYSQDVYGGNNTFSQKEIMGMSPVGVVSKRVQNEEYNNFLYYIRNSSNLIFQSIDTVVREEKDVLYGASLASYKYKDGEVYEPEYPATLEAGVYEFGGWYTTAGCYDGTEFNFDTATMPNGDLVVYAKWIPVTHTVEFYGYKDENGAYQSQIGETYEVTHGTKLNEQYIPKLPEDFEYGAYTFNGWYYMDGDTEKRFDFESMTVTEDLVVYAKWTSNTLIKYVISFELGNGTVIADPITGSALAGTTKTFDAKGGTELYAKYQEGYFPDVQSHSITLDIEDEDGIMYFKFVYTAKEAIPYTVYYVTDTQNDSGTLTEIVLNEITYYIVADTKSVSDNRNAVVTENFKVVSGYAPDAYQKSLVVVDGAENVITFYYTADTTHAYYKVSHYTQNLDGETWTEYYTYQSQGTIGDSYKESPMTITGFTYDSDTSNPEGTLAANGLHLKLYYTRNKYPYKVEYREQTTGAILNTSEIINEYYGKVVSATAPDTYENYKRVSDATQSITIRIEENLTDPTLNVIIFYYEEKEVTINYVVVGPDGSGMVEPGSENVKISTGAASGSTATANSDYTFVGWYTDESCTNAVPSGWVDTNNKITPQKSGDLWMAATYYAKFETLNTSLTIDKTYPEGADYSMDEKQTFIFDIKGTDGTATADIKLTVTIHEDGEITITNLPIGTYTVTEHTNWSWRYEPTDNDSADGEATRTITLSVNAANNVVTFENTRSGEKTQWLDGNDYRVNIFNGVAD